MKGPMLTRTLQDIIGKEPHHWRGDRDGLESFGPAFLGLLGDDVPRSASEMQAFEDFLAHVGLGAGPPRTTAMVVDVSSLLTLPDQQPVAVAAGDEAGEGEVVLGPLD